MQSRGQAGGVINRPVPCRYALERNWALTFNCTDPGIRYSCCEQWDMVETDACRTRPPGMKGGSVVYPRMQPGDCGCMDDAPQHAAT